MPRRGPSRAAARSCQSVALAAIAALICLAAAAAGEAPPSPSPSPAPAPSPSPAADHHEPPASPAPGGAGGSSNTTSGTSPPPAKQDGAGEGAGGDGGAECVKDPSTDHCKGFEYGDAHAEEDLKQLCKAKAFLSECSLFRLCTQGGDPASIGKSPVTCKRFQLLATACSGDALAAEHEACKSYKALCLSPKTVVQQCNATGGLKHILPTSAIKQLARSMCSGGSGDPQQCKRCDWKQDEPACDLFSVYGGLCAQNPGMSECRPWEKMCRADGSLYVCREQLPGGRPGLPGPPMIGSSGSSSTPGGTGGTGAGAPEPPQQWAPSAAGGLRASLPVALGAVLLAAVGAL